ncbi:2-dehydropantoate 2-reductase [Pseudoduganella rivuli]|uniref:2-dehydropantoate 2-reductase n=1 Tax=Pseudoduganella rivuli TaxID=2666085 RepID=UPI001E5AB63C|nr:2-dehydropantoate 2-reductase [Pseudoduganella rivuli]
MKKIMILGAGAMGSLFGARLALAGNDVLLVWRASAVHAARYPGAPQNGNRSH